jgi:hypothetical protein
VSQISPNVSSGPFLGNGAQTAFAFNFSIIEKHQILVEVDGVALAPLVGYSVVFGDTSGTVTFTTAPADGAQILLMSNPDYVQTSNFDNQGAYNLSTVNLINRRGVIRDLVLKDASDRSLKVPVGATPPPPLTTEDAEGRVVGYASGRFVWVPNNAAAVTADSQIAREAASVAQAAAGTASDDANRAELAAAVAALSAGIYINEATGRAAVANGVVFAAVGTSGDKAVDIWQRVNAGASTLLRSYPSLAALNTAIANLDAVAAWVASKDSLNIMKAALEAAAQDAAVSLQAGMAYSLAIDRILYPVTYVDNVMGTNAAGYGAHPRKPVSTFAYAYVDPPVADTTILLRHGQRSMLTPPADGNDYYIGGLAHHTNLGGFGPDGNYGFCLDTRLDLSALIWTASGGGWNATVTARNALNFTGAANIAGVHLMLWKVSAPHDDPLGEYCELHIGGANPAANDAAVDATNGVNAWSIKYAGQVAGDIRGTGHIGDTFIFHMKTADGTSPAGQPFFWPDHRGGITITCGSHGHAVVIGSTGKDSVSFTPAGNASLGLIPWFESFTLLGGGGHGGVGPKCTVGRFKSIGVPIPGEATFASGQSGGAGCHNFSAGFDFSNQYLYNGSIETGNYAVASLYAHGSGAGIEAYLGWNVPGDIISDNDTTTFEIEVTLIEGLKHGGRLLTTNNSQIVNSYPGQNFWLARRGGLFRPKYSQAVIANYTGGGGRTTVIGSVNPDEPYIIDAANCHSGAPDFVTAILYARRGADGDPPPTLILMHVEDRTDTSGGVLGFSVPDSSGFYVNAGLIHLWLIGVTLKDGWPSFDYAPHYPASLHVDATSTWGLHGRDWATIEADMATLGRVCIIEPGATAVDPAGNVVDVKI